MLTFVLLLLCSLSSNTISQIIPLRFDHAINRLRQFQNLPLISLIEDVQYNFTLEYMLNRISFSITNNNTSACERDFDLILRAASQRDMWALKVLDAWGKPLPSGVLKGNLFWVGDYNECLQLSYNPTNKSFVSQPFDTQYCKEILIFIVLLLENYFRYSYTDNISDRSKLNTIFSFWTLCSVIM